MYEMTILTIIIFYWKLHIQQIPRSSKNVAGNIIDSLGLSLRSSVEF